MNPDMFLERDVFLYMWRGKTKFEKCSIRKFDKIRKNYTLFAYDTRTEHKTDLSKETYFFMEDLEPET